MEIVRKFNSIDLFALTCCSTITLGVTFLPYVGGDEVRSAWLKVLITVLPYLFLFYLLKKFSKKYKSYDMFLEFKKSVWGWVYAIVVIYFIGSTIVAIIFGLESLMLITKIYLLPNTEQWIILLLFLVVSCVGLGYGMTAISRFVVALIFVEFVLLFTIIALGFSEYFRWIYLPPIWTTSITTFLKSSISDMARYSGVVAMIGVLPFLKENTEIFKPMSYGILLVTSIYTSICIIVVGTFGFEQTMTLISPFTALVQSLSTRMGVFERLDLFFLGIWLIAYFKIMLIHTWFLLFLVKRLINIKREFVWICGSLIVIYVFTLVSPNFVEVVWLPLYINQVVYSFIIPVLVLLLLILKRNKGVSQIETN